MQLENSGSHELSAVRLLGRRSALRIVITSYALAVAQGVLAACAPAARSGADGTASGAVGSASAPSKVGEQAIASITPANPVPTSAPTLTPAPTSTPTADQAWSQTLSRLDATWERDWPEAIKALSDYDARFPGRAEAHEKLYAALLAYGGQLARDGQAVQAAPILQRARTLRPDASEPYELLVRIRPTAVAAEPTPRPQAELNGFRAYDTEPVRLRAIGGRAFSLAIDVGQSVNGLWREAERIQLSLQDNATSEVIRLSPIKSNAGSWGDRISSWSGPNSPWTRPLRAEITFAAPDLRNDEPRAFAGHLVGGIEYPASASGYSFDNHRQRIRMGVELTVTWR